MDKVCRICMVALQDLKPLYGNVDLIQKLEAISMVELSLAENMPSKICQQCTGDAEISFIFRNKIIESENYFSRMGVSLLKAEELDHTYELDHVYSEIQCTETPLFLTSEFSSIPPEYSESATEFSILPTESLDLPSACLVLPSQCCESLNIEGTYSLMQIEKASSVGVQENMIIKEETDAEYINVLQMNVEETTQPNSMQVKSTQAKTLDNKILKTTEKVERSAGNQWNNNVEIRNGPDGTSIYVCMICGEEKNSKTKIVNHKMIHVPKIACEVCGLFIRPRNMKVHMTVHKKTGGKSIARRKSRINYDDVDTKVNSDGSCIYTCKICGEKMDSKTKVGRHGLKHKEKVTCKICGKQMTNEWMKRHLVLAHNVEEENLPGDPSELLTELRQEDSLEESVGTWSMEDTMGVGSLDDSMGIESIDEYTDVERKGENIECKAEDAKQTDLHFITEHFLQVEKASSDGEENSIIKKETDAEYINAFQINIEETTQAEVLPTKTPQTKTPETKTPETKTLETKSPQTKTPKAKTFDTKTVNTTKKVKTSSVKGWYTNVKIKTSPEGTSIYECMVCGEEKDTRKRIVNHKLVHEPKIACEVCGIFLTPRYMKDHMNLHKKAGGKPIIPRKPRINYDDIEVKVYSDGSCIYICKICGKRMDTKKKVGRHSLNHEEKVSCKICGKLMMNEWMKRHLLLVHNVGEEVKTDKKQNLQRDTSEELKQENSLEVSIGTRRMEDTMGMVSLDDSLGMESIDKYMGVEKKEGENIQCEAEASKNTVGNIRRKRKTLKKSICPICGKFLSSTHMTKHQLVHKNEAITCPICGNVAKNLLSYTTHKRYHIPEDNTCDECGRKFTNKGSFRAHRNRHKAQAQRKLRLFKCDICSKGFGDKNMLERHLQKHSGLRPYPCKYCDKSLSTPYALKTHMRLHTKEKPYKCELCPMAFPQRVSLRTHMKSKHNVVVKTVSPGTG